MKKIFKRDSYKRARGGESKLLEISCVRCGEIICTYQKDGIGMLKRMYLDRIRGASTRDDYEGQQLSTLFELACHACTAVLGKPMIYKKENRLAFRLVPGAVKKRIVK